ncbi:hypothetical protein [Chryseobacterium elymi]|nr:hypothetical protein [Chryseobacterium elymi]
MPLATVCTVVSYNKFPATDMHNGIGDIEYDLKTAYEEVFR